MLKHEVDEQALLQKAELTNVIKEIEASFSRLLQDQKSEFEQQLEVQKKQLMADFNKLVVHHIKLHDQAQQIDMKTICGNIVILDQKAEKAISDASKAYTTVKKIANF